MTPSPQKTRRRQLSSTQITFAAIVAIGLMLAINFSDRIEAERELEAIQDTVEQEIELLQREQRQLEQDLAYVNSDAYVADWARREGRMVQPNELLVVPIPDTSALELTPTPEPTILIETSPPTPEPWQVWWALFFDSPAPRLGD